MSPKPLFGTEDASLLSNWTCINDNVMGGVSSSAYRVSPTRTLEFSGLVSLEQNGGFASISATTDALDISAFDAFLLRIRADGKRYALSVQTDYRIMAGGYYYFFPTQSGEWQEISIPFGDLQARSFGRPLKHAPPFDKSNIRAIGFLISEGQAGPFQLEVDWIKVQTLV